MKTKLRINAPLGRFGKLGHCLTPPEDISGEILPASILRKVARILNYERRHTS